MRSRVPTSRKPACRWSARLAAFAGKMLACSLHSPLGRERVERGVEQRAADPSSPGLCTDVDADLGHTGVRARAWDWCQGGPAEDLAGVLDDQPRRRQVVGVEVVPRRCGGTERRIAGGDALV
jgi:hypothetical protein